MRKNAIHIFIAYAPEDENICQKLMTHLKSLERTGKVVLWHYGLIKPGQVWEKTRQEQLYQADIILLLISADFVNAPYCYEQEMTAALQLQTKGQASVIPIITRYCVWQDAPFAALKVLPHDGTPIKSEHWGGIEDKPYAEIVEAIRGLISPKKQLVVPIKRKSFSSYFVFIAGLLVLGSLFFAYKDLCMVNSPKGNETLGQEVVADTFCIDTGSLEAPIHLGAKRVFRKVCHLSGI